MAEPTDTRTTPRSGHPIEAFLCTVLDDLQGLAEVPVWSMDAETTTRVVALAARVAAGVAEVEARAISQAQVLDLAGAVQCRDLSRWVRRTTGVTGSYDWRTPSAERMGHVFVQWIGAYDWRKPSAERMGHAFVQWISGYDPTRLPRIGGLSATVVVVGDYEILTGKVKAASLETGTRISHTEFLTMACAAGIIPAWMNASGEVLALGRTHRFHTPAQRLAAIIEQHHCQHHDVDPCGTGTPVGYVPDERKIPTRGTTPNTSGTPMHHDTQPHEHTGHESMSSRTMALSATLHCLTGCAIGEIAGLMIGTAVGLANGATIALSIALAFLFGYTLSTLPLLKAGLGVGAALGVVLAADTLSIASMEVADNVVMALIPGAMDAGLVNPVFWVGMMIALTVAFLAAYPVNRHLLARGKGHALTHAYHRAAGPTTGPRRLIPTIATSTLVAAITAFMLGGLVVSLADRLGEGDGTDGHATSLTGQR